MKMSKVGSEIDTCYAAIKLHQTIELNIIDV